MKLYCIDTNILLEDGSALKKLGKNQIVIPFVVLEELDRNKTRPGEVGRNARLAIRFLDSLRSDGSLLEGIQTKEGAMVIVHREPAAISGLDLSIADNSILATAIELKASVLTNDINLRVKCDVFKVKSEAHSSTSIADSADDVYSGFLELDVDSSTIDQLYGKGECDLIEGLIPNSNQCVLLKSNTNKQHTGLGRVTGNKLRRIVKHSNVFGISPRNAEQTCALDLLMDKTVPLVSLMGAAGCGKTLISLASSLEMVLQHKEYERLIVMRPPIPMGRDIGYLPGSLLEKMMIWAGSIQDNIGALVRENKKETLEHLIELGILEIMPPTFIRGRSLANSILLVDEAQSLSVHEIKTIVTRMGEGSKLIMTGDIRQIDDARFSAVDNGFSYMVEKFRSYDLVGHITLQKTERSGLASLAAEVL